MMPKVALLFAFLVFPLILANSYALPFDELNSFDDFQNHQMNLIHQKVMHRN